MSNNNNKIVLTASLEIAQTVAQINKDLDTVQQRLNQLTIDINIDADLRRNIKSLANDLSQIRTIISQIDISRLNINATQSEANLSDIRAELSEIRQLISQLNNHNININTSQAEEGIRNIGEVAENAGNATNSLATNLRNALGDFGFALTAHEALEMIKHAAEEALEAVKEFNKMQTNLQIITGGSDSEVNDMIADYADKSILLGIDISEYENAAETILRTGKSIEDTNTLLEDSIVLSKTGFIDAEKSAESLITIGNAYNYEAKQMKNVLDKFLALDTASNTEAGALSESVAKTAKNAQLAGVGIDSLSAQISNLKNVTGKSEDEIATSLNSIYSRMYNVKLGKFIIEDETGIADITEDINDTEKILNTVGISLRNSKQEFRDFDDIIKDLSDNWKSFNSVQKQAISKTIGGTYHKNTVISMIEEYEDFQKLQDISINSTGQATEKYESYLSSIEAKSASFTTALKQLYSNTIPSEFISKLKETGTEVIKFIDEYEILQNLLKSTVIYGVARGFISLSGSLRESYTSIANLSNAFNSVGIIKNNDHGTTAYQTALNNLSISMANLNDSQTRLLLSSNNLSEAQQIAILRTTGLTEAEARARLVTLGLATAENTATTSTFSLSGGLKALWVTISANPIGAITTGLMALMSVQSLIKNNQEIATEKAEEARQKALEAAEAYQEETKALSDLQARYSELVISTNDRSDTKEELLNLQDELISKYGEEADAVDLINEKYSENIKLMQEDTRRKADNFIFDNEPEYEKLKSKMETSGNIIKDDSVTGGWLEVGDENAITIKFDVGGDGFNDAIMKAWKEAGLDNIQFPESNFHGTINTDYMRAIVTGTPEEQLDTMIKATDIYREFAEADKNVIKNMTEKTKLLREQVDEFNLLDSQMKTAKDTVNGFASIPSTTQTEFDTLLDKAVELKGAYTDASTITGKSAIVNELNTLQNEITKLTEQYPELQTVANDTFKVIFGSIESGSLSASTSLSTLKEQFSTYFDESFTPALDNISKVEEAMQTLKDGELLDFDTAWGIIDLDEEGLLSKISQINGEMKLDHEELITLKDQLIAKVREQIVEDNQAAQASIDSAKIRLEAEMAVLRAKQMSVNSASDIQYLEQQRQIVQDIKDEISGYENIIDKNYLLLRQLNSHLGDTVNYTQAIESEMSQIEDRISDIKDEVNALQDKADNLLKAQEEKIDSIIDKLEDEKEVLNDQLEIYEKQQEELEEIIDKYEQVADVVNETIHKEIEAIEEQRTQVEDYYDNLIDNLKEANEEREDALNMAEKLAAVENAKNNKVRVYREDVGWNYEVDKETLKNAENDLLSAQNEAEIKKLEKEKEKAVEGYDEQIESLEEYAELWEEVVNSVTEAENELVAIEILGSDWREKIKNKDTTILTKFKYNFTAYNTQLSSLVNNEIATLKKSIEAKEAEIESWQDYQSQVQESAKAIETAYSSYASIINGITLTESSNWEERQNNLSAFTEAYKGYINEISSKNAEIQLMESNLDSLATKLESIDSSSLTNSISDIQSLLAEVGDFETAIDEINSIIEKMKDNPTGYGTRNSVGDVKRYDLLEQLAKLLNIPGCSQGGIHDKTGLVMMHGSNSASEVTFNANDAKKLYQLVHSTPNLVASMQEGIVEANSNPSGITNTTNHTENSKKIEIQNLTVKANNVEQLQREFDRLANGYFGTKLTESKVY